MPHRASPAFIVSSRVPRSTRCDGQVAYSSRFFFNDTATTEIYTLSLHDALPISAPCNLRISKEEYRKDIDRLIRFLEGGKVRLLAELKGEMEHAAKELKFEQAARLRDEIRLLEKLDRRGELDTHAQPEVFYVDPKKGLAGLKKVLKLAEMPRTIEGVDIAHLGGGQTVASVVQFLDGLPFKPGYRRYKVAGVSGI